ncbi:pentapeptide repeat-containing protein [Morganella psychrotolerans]|uniref:Pentapeptide repeat-containing protein n=1 Tax=Morganella psychrotolerans TaxID=368603 RepID=A0A1B8HCG3_9GAMM|nr:pentapeptide repeat-containing protein [Morganella psychrotolerans]OBU06767.1 hypothetical protein AYY18_19840 [Morganella psychrotolerans]
MKNVHKKDFLLSKRDHRVTNFWDVNYEPDFNIDSIELLMIGDVNKQTNKEIIDKNIYIGFDEIKKNDERPDVNMRIENKSFKTCDFSGNNGKKKITFLNCKFEKCYFSFSEFNDVNFTNCNFQCCSFSQAKFYRCFFDDNCRFYNISISGSTTLISQTEIRASKFFKKIYKPYDEQLDLYKSKGLNRKEEIFRLNRSVLKVSKVMLESNRNCSNDDVFYDSVKNLFIKKLNDKKSSNSYRIEQLRIELINKKKDVKLKENKAISFRLLCLFKIIYLFLFKKTAFFIEGIVMKMFGFINGWGSSLPRVFIFGVLILLIYTIIYMFMDGGQVPVISVYGEAKNVEVTSFYYFTNSLLKSFDVTFLAGYTKHITMYDSILKQLTLLTNMLVGLFWYSVLIPTLINKISVNKI